MLAEGHQRPRVAVAVTCTHKDQDHPQRTAVSRNREGGVTGDRGMPLFFSGFLHSHPPPTAEFGEDLSRLSGQGEETNLQFTSAVYFPGNPRTLTPG